VIVARRRARQAVARRLLSATSTSSSCISIRAPDALPEPALRRTAAARCDSQGRWRLAPRIPDRGRDHIVSRRVGAERGAQPDARAARGARHLDDLRSRTTWRRCATSATCSRSCISDESSRSARRSSCVSSPPASVHARAARGRAAAGRHSSAPSSSLGEPPIRTIRRPAVPSIHAVPSAPPSCTTARSASSTIRATEPTRACTTRLSLRACIDVRQRGAVPCRSRPLTRPCKQRLDDLRSRHGVPGASLGILRDDEVSSVASGVLNLDTGVEATVDSLFQIGLDHEGVDDDCCHAARRRGARRARRAGAHVSPGAERRR